MVSDFKKTARPYSTSLETLTRDATLAQRDEIERALSENADAVEALAIRVLNDPEINNPIACFLSKLRNGAHRTRQTRADGTNERNKIEIPWDPALASENAEKARALIQRLTGKPTLIDAIIEDEPINFAAAIPAIEAARPCDPEPDEEDDDIPGYGDAT